MKVSEHWVKSPLLMVNRACQTCHPYPEKDLLERVETIQDRHYALMTRAGEAAVDMLDAIKELRQPYTETARGAAEAKAHEKLGADPAYQNGSDSEKEAKMQAEIKSQLLAAWRKEITSNQDLKKLEELQRAAQWRLDYVAAENSMGFHAPQEMARVLGESIDLSRQVQALARSLDKR